MGKWEGGDEEGQKEGEMGKLAKGRGRTRGKRRGDFTDGYEMLGWTYGMPVWNEVTELFDCLPVQRWVPQLVYTNKAGDCLSISLSFFLSVRLWTAKLQGLMG